jgi:hypothetical protein
LFMKSSRESLMCSTTEDVDHQFGPLVPRASVEGRAEGLRAFRVRAAAGS